MKLPPRVKALFRPPFAACPEGVFVFDTDSTCASSHDESFGMIPRGWGRIQYITTDDPGAAFDEWAAWFRDNVPASSTAVDVAKILNDAWAGGEP